MNTNCIKQVALNTIETAFADKKDKAVSEKPMRYFLISHISNDTGIKVGYRLVKLDKYPSINEIRKEFGRNAIPLCITEPSEQDCKDFLK